MPGSALSPPGDIPYVVEQSPFSRPRASQMSNIDPSHMLPGIVPAARQRIVTVVEQEHFARDTYRLRLASSELAGEVLPGQFFMIRQPGVTNPLLGRPFALYDTYLDGTGTAAGIDVVYLVVGKMTGLMSGWGPGDSVEVWGPLGNGFPVPAVERLLLVGGGIGVTPFCAVAREALGRRSYGKRRAERRPQSISLCYGVRSQDYFCRLEDFDSLGIDMQLATDDGSRGHKGFVTDLVTRWLNSSASGRTGSPAQAIYCCGPEPMMHAVAELAAQHRVDCWLSLETPMACGFGACFSCVTRVTTPDGGWDYRRVCVEGPIFRADQLAP